MKNLIDLSHVVENGLVTYKGLPAPIICDYMSREASKVHYSEGTSFHIGRIDMVANTGTYIDSPFHRYATGNDLSELPLESLAEVDGIVIRVDSTVQAIDDSHFRAKDIAGKAVLVQTDWSRHWNTEKYYEGHPYLTESAADFLAQNNARIVGIDSYNIDDTSDGRRPVHTIVLEAGIPIVEHMCNLSKVPNRAFRFSAVPVKVRAFGTFPVRAYASYDDA